MPLIDDRGRLFGKVNLIDAVFAFVALGLIPLAYGAFLLFRVPEPTITSISPAQIIESETGSLQIAGEDLRPFLRAKIGTFDAAFLVQSPTLGEIKLPPKLAPGAYDVVLLDEGQELVRKAGALTVVRKAGAVASVRVRFVAEPEVLDVMKVGDVDLGGSLTPADADRAVLTQVGSDRRTLTALTNNSEGLLGRTVQLEQPVLAFTGTVRVPVVFTPSGWSYNDRPVKVGAPFTFETVSGAMMGSIISMTLSQEKASVAR